MRFSQVTFFALLFNLLTLPAVAQESGSEIFTAESLRIYRTSFNTPPWDSEVFRLDESPPAGSGLCEWVPGHEIRIHMDNYAKPLGVRRRSDFWYPAEFYLGGIVSAATFRPTMAVIEECFPHDMLYRFSDSQSERLMGVVLRNLGGGYNCGGYFDVPLQDGWHVLVPIWDRPSVLLTGLVADKDVLVAILKSDHLISLLYDQSRDAILEAWASSRHEERNAMMPFFKSMESYLQGEEGPPGNYRKSKILLEALIDRGVDQKVLLKWTRRVILDLEAVDIK